MEPNNKIPDGIYYIVLADLAASTEVAAKMGNTVFSARIHAFVEASKTALANANKTFNSGRFLKSVGDGVLIAFHHFPDVVQWSKEFECTLISAAIPPLQARICVHAGEIHFEHGDPTGLAINQLFKIEKQIPAGEICLTDVARELALPSLYPRQCELKQFKALRLAGQTRRTKLHRLDVRDDLAFLIDKTAPGGNVKMRTTGKS